MGGAELTSRKTYGSIPDISVGSWWETRYAVSPSIGRARVDFKMTARRAVRMPSTRELSSPTWHRVMLTLYLRPWVAGIAPGPKGAYSVALSGGYEDDIDEGEALYVPSTCDLELLAHPFSAPSPVQACFVASCM